MFNSRNLGLYSYAHLNAVRFIDPDGNESAPDPKSLGSALLDTGKGVWNAGVGLIEGAPNLIGGAIPGAPDYVPFLANFRSTYDTPAFGTTIEVLTGVGAFKVLGELGSVSKMAPAVEAETVQTVKPVINTQKQAGHIPGTPQNINRVKQGKPTSTFHGEQSGEMATQIANERGAPLPGRPNVKEYDFGVGVGVGPNGGTQTRVRVHTSPKTGEIHGHPSGPEKF